MGISSDGKLDDLADDIDKRIAELRAQGIEEALDAIGQFVPAWEKRELLKRIAELRAEVKL